MQICRKCLHGDKYCMFKYKYLHLKYKYEYKCFKTLLEHNSSTSTSTKYYVSGPNSLIMNDC